jgi:hypothetical protein
MSIVGSHPESGVRIDIERPIGDGPPWRYEGEAVTPTERFPLVLVVTADGSVEVDLPAEAPGSIAKTARGIVRTACKHSGVDAIHPPRRIVRWRSER